MAFEPHLTTRVIYIVKCSTHKGAANTKWLGNKGLIPKEKSVPNKQTLKFFNINEHSLYFLR